MHAAGKMSRQIIEENVVEDLQFKFIPEPKALKVKEISNLYLFTDEIIQQINDTFDSEMELGLMRNPPLASSLQMANTFVPKLITGNEKGEFLSLDLGGTNFRVILLTLDPEGPSYTQSIIQYYTVPEPLRMGEGQMLFDFLADCIHDFLNKENMLEKKLPLGFCFSFPMIQTGIDAGILVTWTKSFKCSNVVDKEVVSMLRKGLIKHKIHNVEVVAIINDTTGTMMTGSCMDKKTAIGLILGTGCNAAYFEKVENIKKWEGSHPGVEEVIVDIEWGAFGDNGVLDFMKTEVDRAVDDNSLIVHSFTFEKLFSGRYVGEIVKRVLNQLISEGLMSQNVYEDWNFTAEDVSNTMEVNGSNFQNILDSLRKKGFKNATFDDADIVHHICAVISVRGALLVSICLANLLRRMNRSDASIAVDGSLFRIHPKYKNYMEKFISALAPNRSFQLILAHDGSGIGAALTAAVITSLDTAVLHSQGDRTSH